MAPACMVNEKKKIDFGKGGGGVFIGKRMIFSSFFFVMEGMGRFFLIFFF